MSDTENIEDEGNFEEIAEDNFNLDNNGNPIVNETIIEEGNEENEGENDTHDIENNNGNNEEGDNNNNNTNNEEDNGEEDDEDKKKKKKKHIDEEEHENKKVFDNAFYNIDDLKPKLELKQVPDSFADIVYIFGFESEKLNNLYFLTEESFISAIGNYVYVININSLKQKYIPGIKNGGIGAIAVHPSMSYFAIAEKVENDPFIYIYEYPSYKLYRILRNGSIKGYSAICFNNEGTRLASVGADPDYTLTIWDWQQESVILRSKAFSQ
eukprot:jgi/Orpsp1_1/1182529/evm.model.c7180000081659.1